MIVIRSNDTGQENGALSPFLPFPAAAGEWEWGVQVIRGPIPRLRDRGLRILPPRQVGAELMSKLLGHFTSRDSFLPACD